MTPELLNPCAWIPDFPSWSVRRHRRKPMKRLIIGSGNAGVCVELYQNPFEVIVEIFQAVEECPFHVTDGHGLVVVDITDIRSNRP